MKSLLAAFTLTALGLAHLVAGGGQLIASDVAALFTPHHTVAITPSVPWHASGTSQTAAVFNATVAIASTSPAHPVSQTPSTAIGVGVSAQPAVPAAATVAITKAPTASLSSYVTKADLPA